MIAAIEDVPLVECYAHAYNEIKNRKGYLNAEGLWIKES
jgi:hypothetical protein